MEPKHPMNAVLEDMGRAAREGRARHYRARMRPHGVDVALGEATLEPTHSVDVTVGEPTLTPTPLSEQDLKDLEDLQTQR